MFFQDGLVFYDLEWTGSELLQIGAVHESESFERTILTNSDIHYKVTEKILLKTIVDTENNRQVFDCSRNITLKSSSLESALGDFLDWIQDVYFRIGKVILVSHGCNDIPVLYQSFCQVNLDELFLERVTDFVNFQDYLKAYFPELPVALFELVKTCQLKENYRLHLAIDDSRALRDVFHKLHEDNSKFNSNTSLVLTNITKFGFDFKVSSKVSVPYVVLDKNCKQMKLLSKLVNKKAEIQLVKCISDWSEKLKNCKLFEKVMPPNCFMLCVDGWIVQHCNVVDSDSGDSSIRKVSTIIELLCYLGETLFFLKYFPNSQSTFMKRKLLLNDQRNVPLQQGTKIIAKIQLKSDKEPKVMYLLPGETGNCESIISLDAALVMINSMRS